MAVILGRTIILPTPDSNSAPASVGKFLLDEIDLQIERVLEVATLLDERLARDMRILGVEPDPENFNDELATSDTCELAYCRNNLEAVHDMLGIFKDRALASAVERER